MNIQPLQLARVSSLLSSNLSLSQINDTEKSLLDVQNQISTGKRLQQASDDPADAAVAIQLKKTLDQRQTYLTNLSTATSQLGEVDSSLGDLTSLIQQAQSIASANVGSDVTAEERQGAAAQVQAIYNQALTLGNKQLNGVYLFAGDKSTDPPFATTSGGVQFVGSTNVLQNAYDVNTIQPFMINGANVFGALSRRVQGSADLTPNLAMTTRIADLRGANNDGVHLGVISISDGSTSALVDLSKADSVGDIVNAINNAAPGAITASITGKGLTLSTTGADNITVQDVGNGTTASDLGIVKTTGGGPGAPVTGASIQAKITPLTPLSALKGGTGVDLTHGLKITNGGQNATISMSGLTTVEDLLNKINNSGTNVLAQIDPSGTGIDIVNPTQGAPMSISENGGTTAADLGVQTFNTSTPLGQLNGGKGVQISSAGPDFQITRSDGTSFNVSLAGAVTVQDVISKINAAAGTGVTAAFSGTANGITLTDTAGGPGTLKITALNASTAATNLGLMASPAAGNVITGADVNPVSTSGVFANLANLQQALQNGNQAAITDAAQGLKDDYDRVVRVRGSAGAMVQEMQARQSTIQDENVATQSMLSNLTDTDMASAISKFQTLQTALQATLETTARTMHQSLLDFLS
jgi:flagellar hook-associated protein 3